MNYHKKLIKKSVKVELDICREFGPIASLVYELIDEYNPKFERGTFYEWAALQLNLHTNSIRNACIELESAQLVYKISKNPSTWRKL